MNDASTMDAADLVEQTYHALRQADYAERDAQAQLLEIAHTYATTCTRGALGWADAEEQLIQLGDAAIELDHRRHTFERCQQEMKLIWRTVPVRSRR